MDIFSILKEAKFPTKFSNTNVNMWYHLVPKNANLSKGILSPHALQYFHMDDLLVDALKKYKNRMVDGWNIYPDRNPDELTIEELMKGLNSHRGKWGTHCIYLFKYPPYKSLGKYMERILNYRKICKIDITKIPDIVYIDYNLMDAKGKKWFETVSKKEYFSNYDEDNNSGLLFAQIPHIALATKSGIIPRSAIVSIT